MSARARVDTSTAALLRAVVGSLPGIISAFDRNGTYILSEGRDLARLGLRPGDRVGQSLFALYHDRPDVVDAARRALAGEATIIVAEMQDRVFESCWTPLHDAHGRVTGALSVATDVTERIRAEEALRASERRFRALTEHATDLVAIVDARGLIRYASPSYWRVLGYAPPDLEATPALDLVHPDDRARVGEAMGRRAEQMGTVGEVEFRVRHAEGSWRTIAVTTNNQLHDPAVRGIITTSRDVTERKRVEEALQHQALHDALTSLPNRTLLHDRLRQALRIAERERTPLALFLIDLDRFKEVNDTLGHDAGDALLRHIAGRVRGVLRASDTVARLGGDEFAVVLPGAGRPSAIGTARKMLSALAEPVTVEGQSLTAGGSIGIALYPDHGEDVATLMRHADVAMYAAKRAGGGQTVYSPEMDRHTPHRLIFISALHRAITNDELRLHYQPTVEVAGGHVQMVEALVRWQHPELGLLPPDRFIPLAEGTGLIVPLTRWVLATALHQVRAWLDDGLDLGVAVNLSARTVHDPDLAGTIAEMLRASGVPAARLRVELTESAVMTDPSGALEVLTRLAGMGVRIAIDDFGTGYSSLAYLKRLPIDEIKIDRSFVTNMATDTDDATIVASTIGLGHSLGLRFVAEGVESHEAWRALEALGCDGAQGYYFSHALPPDDLARWLRETPWARGETEHP